MAVKGFSEAQTFRIEPPFSGYPFKTFPTWENLNGDPKFSEKIREKSARENRAFSGLIGAFPGRIGAFSGPRGPFFGPIGAFWAKPLFAKPPVRFPRPTCRRHDLQTVRTRRPHPSVAQCIRITREGRNCRFQKTPSTEGGAEGPAIEKTQSQSINPILKISISIENWNLDQKFQSRSVSIYGALLVLQRRARSKISIHDLDRSKFSIPKVAIDFFQSPGPLGEVWLSRCPKSHNL